MSLAGDKGVLLRPETRTKVAGFLSHCQLCRWFVAGAPHLHTGLVTQCTHHQTGQISIPWCHYCHYGHENHKISLRLFEQERTVWASAMVFHREEVFCDTRRCFPLQGERWSQHNSRGQFVLDPGQGPQKHSMAKGHLRRQSKEWIPKTNTVFVIQQKCTIPRYQSETGARPLFQVADYEGILSQRSPT